MSRPQKHLLIACWMLIALPVMGQSRNRPLAPRAQPPAMSPRDLQGVFFEDAFAHLRGSRPGRLDLEATPAVAGNSTNTSVITANSETATNWSTVIDGSVLEDEVKRIHTLLAQSVSTPSGFKGGGYRVAWQQCHELALLFGIMARHEAEVRWQRSAPAAAHLFRVAARETRVGTQQSFDVARNARETLQTLIRGGTVTAPLPAGKEGWDALIDRGALMIRLERAVAETIAPGTASEGEFQKRQARLFHEAQLVRGMARVLASNQMSDGDDEDYVAYCQQMMDAATEVVRAAQQQQYEAARVAAGKIQQTCSACHDDYRI